MWITDASRYADIKARIAGHDSALERSAAFLRARAEALSNQTPPTVTDKSLTPRSPSTDLHDYVSISTYRWPNPDTPDGLPYVYRDGEMSPECILYDRQRWDAAADSMVQLIKAGYFLGETRFATTAAQWVRCWFLDAATAMTPHLAYSQFWPGQNTGSCSGIIEFSVYLPILLDHIVLLGRHFPEIWTEADTQELRDWSARLLDWLETSALGIQECGTANNHGSFYDRLVAHLALYLGDTERALTALRRIPERIDAQIEPDGSMPHELNRTCSFGYSLMNCRGFVELALAGRAVGLDLWGYASADGRSIPAAVWFLVDRIAGEANWPYPQIEPIDWPMVWPLLAGARALGGETFRDDLIAHRMPAGLTADGFVFSEPIHPFGYERIPGRGITDR